MAEPGTTGTSGATGTTGASGSTDGTPIGLVVIHGIGDPLPGETLRDFTDTLGAHDIVHFGSVMEERRLRDDPASTASRDVFFPVHLRHGRIPGGTEVVAVEAFWGSADPLAPGRLGVLQGLVSILVDLPSLMHAARVRDSPRVTRAVYHLCAFLSMLLAGVIFALNAVMLVGFGLTAGAYYVNVPITGGTQIVVPIAASALVAAFGFVPWIRFIETRLAMWTAGAICCAMTWAGAPEFAIATFGVTAAFLLVNLVAAVAVLLLLAVAIYVFLQWRFDARQRHRSTETVLLAAFIQFAAWTLVVPSAWAAGFRLAPRSFLGHERWLRTLYHLAAPADGLQWMLLGVVSLSAIAVALERSFHARRQSAVLAKDPAAAVPSARFIVNRQIGFTVAAAAIFGGVVIIVTTFLPPALWRWVAWLVPPTWTAALSGIVVLVLSYGVKPIRFGLDLVNDIVTYLYYRCDRGPARAWSRKGPERSDDPARFRVRAVLECLVADLKVDRLVVVAHSQGTILALDELKDWTGALPPVTLVTCGSPASHLYQFYFPDLVRDFTDDSWRPLFDRLDRWLNFYRLSDYVGTTVERPPIAGFEQRAIALGGHIGYWTHPAFAQAVKDAGVFLYPPQ